MLMKSYIAIIDKYGAADLAEAMGTTESHVRVMRVRNSIPSAYWKLLVAQARQRGWDGLTLDKLYALQQRRFRQGRNGRAAVARAS
jgi:hypothetical protein